MITYNPKDWFKLIVFFHKSDTFRVLLPTMVLLGGLTYGCCYLEKTYMGNEVPSLTIFHSIAGFVVSMVLVFRINTAYDRWWEGRKLWGSLVNNTRNLAVKFNALIDADDIEARRNVHQLISNFPFSLKEHLRGNVTNEDIKFNALLDEQTYTRVAHKPNYLVRQLTTYTIELCNKYPRTPNDYLTINDNLNQFLEISGACERIRSTPIPYSYSIFIKKMIFLYVITMPVSFGLTIGYWSIPIVMIMFYAFASLELISEEIEDPFGTDSNDLPTDELSVKIKENLREILLGDEN